jgi:hypothetical protein
MYSRSGTSAAEAISRTFASYKRVDQGDEALGSL